MSRTAGRSREQTRRLVLDAAAAVVGQRGVGASLDDIAAAAGVSKGGLLYHFDSKDALLVALAETLLEEFRSAVDAALDPADQSPGRLTRAYLRASFAPDVDDARVRDSLLLIAQLTNDAQVAALAAEDHRRWTADLAGDGLPPAVSQLVVAAADGVGAPALWGGVIDRPAAAALRDRLLALTLEPSRWSAVAD